jgi:hypothetical protein
MVSSNGPELLMFSISEMRQVRESSGRYPSGRER